MVSPGPEPAAGAVAPEDDERNISSMSNIKRTLKQVGIAVVATAMTALGAPALGGFTAAGAQALHPEVIGTAASPTGSPGAPTNLTAASGPGAVTLRWKAPGSAGDSAILGYNVYVGTSPGGEGPTPENGGALVTATSYTVTAADSSGHALANGTKYYFEVTAVNSSGQSVVSDEASATPQIGAPGAPTAVSATSSYQAATVEWTVPSNGGSPITSFTVTPYVGGSSLSSTTVNAGAAGSSLDATPGSSDSLVVNGLSNGTAYSFKLQATNGQGTGPMSSASNPVSPGLSAPTAPTGVTANATNASTITLGWTPPASNGGSAIEGYDVYEGTAPGGESSTPVNGSSLITTTSLAVTPLPAGRTYYFTVKAVNAQGPSPASSEVSGEITQSVVPGTPTSVAAVAGYQQATVGWTVPSDAGSPITSFTITTYDATAGTSTSQQVAAGPAGSALAPTPGASDSYAVTGLTNGHSYTFTVTATNSGGSGGSGPASSPSNAVSPGVVAPSAPTSLQLTAPSGNNTELVLDWSAPQSTGDGGAASTVKYNVYEGTALLATTAAGVTTYTASGLTQGQSYTFSVQAVSSSGSTGPGSAAATGTAGNPVPGAPAGLTASPGDGQVTLEWSPPSFAGTGGVTYTVLVGGTPVRNGSGLPGTAFVVAGLIDGVPYTFGVEAVDSAGQTSASNPSVTATPAGAPATPAAPTVTVAGPTSVDVSWAAPAGNGSPVTGYTVTATDITTAAGGGQTCTTTGATSCTVTGLTTGDHYSFAVAATNAVGTSPASPASSPASVPGPVAPQAPTGVVASAIGTNITVNWTAPAGDGGAPVQGYNVYVSTSPAGLTSGGSANGGQPVTGTSTVIDGATIGLTTGQDYYVALQAVNAAGPGPLSQAAQVTTTATHVTATATSRSGPGNVTISGTTAASANVTLYDEWYGRTVYLEKAATTSDAAGYYSFTVHIDKTNHFYVVVNGVQSSSVAAVVTPVTPPVTRVYVTPVGAQGPGEVMVRVTTNQAGAVIHLFDEYYGASQFLQKAVHVAEPIANGNGVWTFQIGNVRATNHFYAVVNGVRSNTVIARVVG